MTFDYKILKAAGLSKADISRLYGVSRQTVHNWFAGSNVHVLIHAKVERVTNAINKAVEAGELPVELGKSVTDRAKKITDIVKAHL